MGAEKLPHTYTTWTDADNQSLSPTIPINDSLSVLWIGCVFTSVDGYYEFRCECIDLFMTMIIISNDSQPLMMPKDYDVLMII